MTLAQDGGKVVSFTHRLPLPQEMNLNHCATAVPVNIFVHNLNIDNKWKVLRVVYLIYICDYSD